MREDPIATAIGGQLSNKEDLSVSTSKSQFSKRAPYDVRWEKVEQIKPNVIGGTYPVSPEQVAAKLIEHMLDHDRAWRPRKQNGSEDPFPQRDT
jgi:anti-sigma28 factor (negative regulator of flagellin synthesis)